MMIVKVTTQFGEPLYIIIIDGYINMLGLPIMIITMFTIQVTVGTIVNYKY
jgi:hypothetical protein